MAEKLKVYSSYRAFGNKGYSVVSVSVIVFTKGQVGFSIRPKEAIDIQQNNCSRRT